MFTIQCTAQQCIVPYLKGWKQNGEVKIAILFDNGEYGSQEGRI